MTSENCEKCGNCRFFNKTDQAPDHGACRFNPPLVLAHPHTGDFNNVFPLMLVEGWCGKYEPAKENIQ